MRSIRCWALLPDGTRCPLESLHGGYFCGDHRMGCQPDPALIFRAPAAEMPNDLVQYLRAAAPEAVFPETPPPPSETLPASAPASPADLSAQASDAPVDTAAFTSPTLAGTPVLEEPMPTLSVSPPEERPQHPHHSNGSPGPAPDGAAMQPEPPEDERRGEPDASSLDWLLGLLKEAMIGVMEGDSPPIQKANAVARLGGLYLKAYGAAELKQANTLLRKRLSELEQRLAAVETPGRDEKTVPSRSSDEGMRVHAAHASAAESGEPTASHSPSPASAIAPGQQHQSPPRHRPGRSGGGRRR